MTDAGLLALLVLLQVAGNVSLSRGLRRIGGLAAADPAGVVALLLRAATNLWVGLGAGLLVAFLILYLAALSRLDLSYILPMTAVSYVATVLLAWGVLGEPVDAARWNGAVLISVGVFLVHRSERRRALPTGGPAERPRAPR